MAAFLMQPAASWHPARRAAVGFYRHAHLFLYPGAVGSHRSLLSTRLQLDPTAEFPMHARGRISSPSSFTRLRLDPSAILYTCAAESHRHPILHLRGWIPPPTFLCVTPAVGSRRRPSFTRARLDPTAFSPLRDLTAIPPFMPAQMDLTAGLSINPARLHPSASPCFTCGRLDLAAGLSLAPAQLDITASLLFVPARLDPPA
ncbi:hypothetical protein C8F04DRAFT_1259291 [Mycena alexandri]|uniref:Uncharacterized protein n=1 Tax=Mycena alexandri TaxID=1745969 RepID=A0AAD6X118_9AGAR|nr:hypothetical protein C8F04DRAFT_1259291 [Mycena alexandri]